jgi:ketosteroid isomerase-like protein
LKIKRRFTSIAVFAVIAFSTVVAGQGRKMPDASKKESDIERVILHLERVTMAAIKDKDKQVLSRILADDFVYRTPAGADTTKTDFLKNIASVPVEIISIWGDDLKVNAYGDMAVLTGVQRSKFQGEDGKEQFGSSAFTDVFIKRKGQWQLVLAYGVELASAPVGQQP